MGVRAGTMAAQPRRQQSEDTTTRDTTTSSCTTSVRSLHSPPQLSTRQRVLARSTRRRTAGRQWARERRILYGNTIRGSQFTLYSPRCGSTEVNSQYSLCKVNINAISPAKQAIKRPKSDSAACVCLGSHDSGPPSTPTRVSLEPSIRLSSRLVWLGAGAECGWGGAERRAAEAAAHHLARPHERGGARPHERQVSFRRYRFCPTGELKYRGAVGLGYRSTV
jgi:hypothetical protein